VIDLVAFQDARLKLGEDKVEFLATLTTFGDKTKPCTETMKEIFNWGAMGPYDKNDYTKKKAELSNKIRKMHRNFISESRDNYRDPNVPRTGKNVDELVKFEDKKNTAASN
jgi:predicted Fe-S protein YdhL (DUF1289 family)